MQTKFIAFFILSVIQILVCCKKEAVQIKGSIDIKAPSSSLFIEKTPLHYKYSKKLLYPISLKKDYSFDLTIPVDSIQIAYLTINDQQYPLVLAPSGELKISVSGNHFLDSVAVQGYTGPWNQRYLSYLKIEKPILQKISAEQTAFIEGRVNNVLSLYKKRYRKAQKYLQNTPLDIFYYKAVGEYLVKRLENITYRRNQDGFYPPSERHAVITEANELHFFSLKSLKAQRAGIRDFTNAYANTFGVKQKLEKKYDQELMQYDIKRLGYSTLDSARSSVLHYINSRDALAYAKMFLIAERIGEVSPRAARPGYLNYLQDYADFPVYTQFLISFYQKVEAVSKGNSAIPFSLPDDRGKKLQIKDFKGKYVLLDFWASWCIPCLNEFPHMKKLYYRYSRDQFEIIGISIEKDSLRWRNALNRFQNPWIQLYGGHGFQQETFKAYRGGGIPFYILITPDGKILRHNDIRPSFNLSQVLDSLITDSI